MKKVMIIIRDGWGHGEHNEGNAIFKANTPNHDLYKEKYPSAIIKATGNDVGNPEGVQGGSEVGHLTIGAGRIVWQPYELINQKIKNREFHSNKALINAIQHCKNNNTNLHLNGLFSDQGVHADYRHMHEILRLCKEKDFNRVFIHLTLDGRDVPEKSAQGFIDNTENAIQEIGVGKIVSMVGRYYSMDRDTNWDRTKKGYDLMVKGIGHKAKNASEGLKLAYERGDKTDYYVEPTIIVDDLDNPISTIKENDGFIWYNFRSDRSRQITAMLNGLEFYPQGNETKINLHYVCFCNYDSNWTLPIAFPQQTVSNNLGNVIASNNLKQLRIAETEKFAHVTFFFNSQIEAPNPGEDRIMITSPKVSSYDQKPEMSAREITEKLIPEIGKYDFILVNFANPDLVGHSGVFEAAVKACETVDQEVGKVVNKALENDYTIFLMADHGNADHMKLENGDPDPSHGVNPVLLSLISKDNHSLVDGGMKNIAPTVLDVMGLTKPDEMDGGSLITH